MVCTLLKKYFKFTDFSRRKIHKTKKMLNNNFFLIQEMGFYFF